MVESARQFPEIAKALETAGYDPHDPTWDQLKTAVEMSGYKERHLYGGSEAHYEPRIVRSEFAPQEYQLWDATTIMNLWSTGAFDESTIMQHRRSGGEIIETIRFRKPYGQMMSGIYSKLSLIKYRPVEEASMWFAAVQDDVQQYDLMQQSLLAEVGEITFGTPIMYPAEEEGLTVPPSLSRNFDVYWARFNVTFRGMSPKDLLEMVVNYALPEGSVAMALFPFLHGSTVENRDEKGIPSVTAEYGGVKVAVGEAWKTSVYYKYLKPTVIAYGEGERTFSWAMSDEAMRAGSHRFNAVIGVPKSSDSVEIAMSAHVRLSQTWLGELFDGELIGGTEAFVVPVAF
jgi:hypothetical protein